jgi:hypothetical protein
MRPRTTRILEGDYTPEQIAKFLLYATNTGRDMPPDRNLAAAKKVLVGVGRESLYTKLGSLPANETALFLAAYNIKREAQAQGRPCSDYTAIEKLAKIMGGKWARTVYNNLKVRGQTLEEFAAAVPPDVLSVRLPTTVKRRPKI